MKAIVVTPYYHPKIGGLEVYARQLNIALKDLKKWEIVVVTSNHDGKQTTEETVDGMKVYRLAPLLKFSNTPLNPQWPFMMRKIFKAEQPDVIIAHTPVPSLADAARVAAPRKTPFVVVYHAATLLKGDSVIFDTIARAYQTYERFLLGRADLICAVSDYVKKQFPQKYQAKTKVVTNAVWERDIVTRRQPTRANFLFVGSLDRTHGWKGLKLIIEAVAMTRDRYGDRATLTVMGDGNDRANYEALARDLGIAAHVTFLGNKTGEEKDDAFRKATALVAYPTSANDAFPTVMLEAWARDVPVVAAKIGPLPSLVKNGKDGYVVRPHDVKALATTLHKVLATPTAERKAIARAAAERTRDNHTWEKQADILSTLVEGLKK
ncbi:MAG TPA: glycosyltransferase family 4 protein [Candidatus Saccharimonadales bacterium]|nr:glycosyltransferase family 4 protein [Candidatus Saccharimonadales bacterium]